MVKFKASDYNDFNIRFGNFEYGYLHRLFDLLYRLKVQYNIYDDKLIYYDDDDEQQAELKGTMDLNIRDRVYLHKIIFKKLYSKRHTKICRQLKLW